MKPYKEGLFKFVKGCIKLFHCMNYVVKLLNRYIRDY